MCRVMDKYFGEDIRRAAEEAAKETAERVAKETAKNLLALGSLSVEEIAKVTGLSVEEIEALRG